MLDAVTEARARLGARGVSTGLPHLGEMRTALRGRGIPLHRSVSRSNSLDGDRDVAEPAIHRLQARREVALAVGAGSFRNGGGALWIIGEIP